MLSQQMTLQRARLAAGARNAVHHSKGAVSGRAPAPARLMMRARAGPAQADAQQGSAPVKSARVLPLIAELLDVTTQTAILETYAGRTAMLGVAVAAALELLLPHQPLFVADASRAPELAGLVFAVVAASAGLAAASKRLRLGAALLEPVLASLTSESRSRGSVSRRSVDDAVDFIFEQSFSGADLLRLFPLEEGAEGGEPAAAVAVAPPAAASSPGRRLAQLRDDEIDSI